MSFAFLKETGRWERTLIVFTSDHGEEMGDHWLMGKGGYFDESYRIPLIVRDPRRAPMRPRRVVRRFTENVDIMPTMLEAIGAPIPLQCDGLSLAPVPGRRPRPPLAHGGALGIRLPRPGRRGGGTRARPDAAPMHPERHARRALQVRPLHQAAAAVLRPGERPGRISPTSPTIPATFRSCWNTPRSCSPGA